MYLKSLVATIARPGLALLVILATIFPPAVHAASIYKAPTGTDLTAGASWQGGTAPTSADMATWTNGSLGASLTLGTSTAWVGISVSNSAASDIYLGGAGTLTNGASGINMSASVVNLTLTNAIVLGANQTWTVNTGVGLTNYGGISSPGGFTLTKSGAGTLTLYGTNTYAKAGTINNGTFNLGSSSQFAHTNVFIVTSNTVANLHGTFTYTTTSASAGTSALEVDNGATVNFDGTASISGASGSTRIGNSGANTAYLNIITGGSYTTWLNTIIGRASDPGVVTVSGGTLVQSNNQVQVGQGASGTLTITNSGNVFVPSATASAFIIGNGALGTVNLSGGTLQVPKVSVGASSSTFNFNGGTLKPLTNNTTANSTAFMSGLTTANVLAGGAIIDTATNAVTIGQSLLNGVAGTDGGLVKLGAGSLILSGSSTYTGPTVVSNGTVFVDGSLNTAGAVSVKSGTTFGGVGSAGNVTVANGGTVEGGQGSSGSLSLASLTLGIGASDLTTATFNVVNGESITCSGSVAVNGTNYITVTGSNPSVGVYTLMTYTGSTPFAKMRLGTVPFALGAFLQDSGSAIQLNVTNNYVVPLGPATWVGNAGSTWNLTNSFDWKLTTGGQKTVYTDGSDVTFDNSATNFTVSLATNVAPNSITITSSSNYLFAGTGTITGATALTDNGPGTLTLANSNSFTGGTFVNGGRLQLGNGGASGSLGGTITDNATVVFNRNDTNAVVNYVTGSGSVVQAGSGTTLLVASSDYTGGTTVSNGTLEVTSTGALTGAGSMAVQSGATLVLDTGVASSFSTLALGAGSTNGLAAGGSSITVTGANGLMVGGPATMRMLAPLPAPGVYDLIGYNGTIGGAGLGALSLALPFPHASGSLITNAAGTSVQLNLTENGSVLWVGNLAGNWDLSGATEWKLGNSGASTGYLDKDVVVFDDTATRFTVNVATNVNPTSVTVSATNNYLFTGSGTITANTTLTMNGAGTVTFANSNVFNGGSVISGGTLQIGNGGTSGAIGGDIADNATLVFNRSDALTYNGLISGSGGLVKQGAGTLTLSNFNTYAGGTIVSNGTLVVFNPLIGGSYYGGIAGSLTVNPGAMVVLRSQNSLGYGTAFVSPINNSGTIIQAALSGTDLQNFAGVTLNLIGGWIGATNGGFLDPTGGTTINSLSNAIPSTIGGSFLRLRQPDTTITVEAGGGPVDLLISAVISQFATGYGFTKAGPGILVVTAASTYSGPTTISAGTLQVGAGGNSGTLGTGLVTDNATLVFNRADSYTVTNYLTGSGALVQAGAGTLTLTNVDDYTGGTTVSHGTLLVNGSLAAGGAVTVNTNAVLGGAGSVGSVAVQAGGAVRGGDVNYSNTLTVATLSLGNGSTATTTSRFKVAAGGNVAATTALNVNGTNLVTILDSTLVVGTNTLFTYGGGSIGGTSGFGGLKLGTLPAGVTAHLIDNGAAVQLAVTSLFTVATNSPVLTNSISGGNLNLSWPADHLGWRLQVQTNTLNVGLNSSWFTWPNSTNATAVSIPINSANPTVFFRLIYP